MFDFFEGIVASKSPEALVVNVSGVGYELFASQKTLAECPPAGERCTIYAQISVREDAMLLYGFASKEEREMFRKLIAITRVGPKLALSILSILRPTELAIAVMLSDITALTSVSGIGKKAAERIVLELREKVTPGMATAEQKQSGAGTGDAATEAMHALVSLGYSSAEAAKAVSSVKTKDAADAEEIILLSLRSLGAKLG